MSPIWGFPSKQYYGAFRVTTSWLVLSVHLGLYWVYIRFNSSCINEAVPFSLHSIWRTSPTLLHLYSPSFSSSPSSSPLFSPLLLHSIILILSPSSSPFFSPASLNLDALSFLLRLLLLLLFPPPPPLCSTSSGPPPPPLLPPCSPIFLIFLPLLFLLLLLNHLLPFLFFLGWRRLLAMTFDNDPWAQPTLKDRDIRKKAKDRDSMRQSEREREKDKDREYMISSLEWWDIIVWVDDRIDRKIPNTSIHSRAGQYA